MFEITTAAGLDRPSLSQLLSDVIRPATFEGLEADEILVAVADSQIAGALVWRLADDLTAFVWCPVVARKFANQSATVERQLLTELIRRSDESGAWFSQCLLTSNHKRERTVLLTNGFEHIAHLKSLRWTATPDYGVGHPEDDLILQVFDPVTDRDRLARLIESTWIDSFDCLKLNGRRTGEEAIRSHDGGDTSLWWIFQSEGHDVGLALLSESISTLSVDYTGVIATARHRGIGRHIVQRILQTAAAQQQTVNLSVDLANTPAIRIYESEGFQTVRHLEVIGRFHPDRC